MKAAPFEYTRAATLAEACALLAEHGADAKLIAGGQSLVPMMAMRLARPAWLVDINRLDELKHVAIDGDALVVGAAVRQCVIERDVIAREKLPLLGRALKWVGHVQTRNRGTVGGSIVHADPSAEIPLVACVLDATLVLKGRFGLGRGSGARILFRPDGDRDRAGTMPDRDPLSRSGASRASAARSTRSASATATSPLSRPARRWPWTPTESARAPRWGSAAPRLFPRIAGSQRDAARQCPR